MPTITVRETYDLSTAPNRLGLIGIHTPGSAIIRKLYPGLWLNYNKVKVNSCNVALACASLLPADPLQIGVEAGDIAPQDLFNPILYRACSTDSFNTILNRMYGTDSMFNLQDGSIAFAGGTNPGDPFPSASDTVSEDVYYGLLSESGWKKAMPQSGLVMRNLVPLVYNVISNYGNGAKLDGPSEPNDYKQVVAVPSGSGGSQSEFRLASIFRGHSFPMPALPTARGLVQDVVGYQDTSSSAQSTVDNSWSFPYFPPTLIPKTYVGCVIIPPSKLHRLYFRMTISWSVSFFEPISIVERGRLTEISQVGIATYGSSYNFGESKDLEDKLTNIESTVDTLDVDAKMIMQS
ncbi:putative capsid protein [Bovine faeces associated smacovirus 2]|uniref:Putative capsid protein n=1 Tax=Bovine faeces associated smacovirus 2 TaxID=1843750 RepID=A0A160HWH2_9VIRU|nr:putative capsid protein [Bovine faeces associated smacovirus 2]ANC51524.1 putative capsid protein [Bovine faeces associated smacovirus 2]